jgi:hypothetical protein
MRDKILDWLLTGSVGASAKAMACAALGKENDRSHPQDPDDLNRCLLLLERVPEIRKHMDKLADMSETWAKLVARWPEVEKTFLDEVGFNWSKRSRAPKTYALMKKLRC